MTLKTIYDPSKVPVLTLQDPQIARIILTRMFIRFTRLPLPRGRQITFGKVLCIRIYTNHGGIEQFRHQKKFFQRFLCWSFRNFRFVREKKFRQFCCFPNMWHIFRTNHRWKTFGINIFAFNNSGLRKIGRKCYVNLFFPLWVSGLKTEGGLRLFFSERKTQHSRINIARC